MWIEIETSSFSILRLTNFVPVGDNFPFFTDISKKTFQIEKQIENILFCFGSNISSLLMSYLHLSIFTDKSVQRENFPIRILSRSYLNIFKHLLSLFDKSNN